MIIAVDVIALMDALKIQKAVLAGFDWGARTANIIAALWPERCKALVSVSGYLIGSPTANEAPLPPKTELAWWCQFYFATKRGRAGYEKHRRDFAKLIWRSRHFGSHHHHGRRCPANPFTSCADFFYSCKVIFVDSKGALRRLERAIPGRDGVGIKLDMGIRPPTEYATIGRHPLEDAVAV